MSKIIDELKDSLNVTGSLPFLFIGSGFSRRYLDLPDWRGLLEKFAIEAYPTHNEFAYQLYRNKIIGDNLPDEDLLPAIAQEIERDYTIKFLSEPKFESLRESYKDDIKQNVSCLKIGIADYFKSVASKFELPSYPEEVEALKAIKHKVAGIITTNYDNFTGYIFDDFKTYVGQDELLFSQLYEMSEIYKIHGCCSLPGSMIITSDDYKSYKQKNAYLSAKLLTIFLEHPVIFLGYSLNDANIKNILDDIVQCLNDEQLKKLAKRLFFVLRASDSRPEKVITREKEFKGRAFQVTEIIRSDFSEIYDTIGKSTPKYKPKVLRALKKDIYELVRTNDPKSRLHYLDIEDTENIDKVDYVLGVGAKHLIGDEGYAGYEPSDLFEDILYDNKEYDHKKIVCLTLPKLLKNHSNSIPVFKYTKNFTDELPERVLFYVTNFSSYDSHLNSTIRKRPALEAHSIEDIKNKYKLESDDEVQKCLADIVKLREEEIDCSELRDLLKIIYEFHPGIFSKETKQNLKSLFRKAAKIYDWMEYCENKK